jgi:hypothetical protein
MGIVTSCRPLERLRSCAASASARLYPKATGVTCYGVSEWSRSQLCGLSQCVCNTQIRRPKRETNAPPRVLIQITVGSSVLMRVLIQ